MEKAWSKFSTANSPHGDNPNFFWETGKAPLRGQIISYAASLKRNTLANYKKASANLRLVKKRSLYTSDSPENRINWQTAKRAFDTWADTPERKKGPIWMPSFTNLATKLANC